MRGTGEAAGTGTSASGHAYASGGHGLLGAVMSTLKGDSVIPVYAEALKYPAAIKPGDPNYLSSVSAGTAALKAEINDVAAKCPHTNIWRAGYSQGAHVMGTVLSLPTSNSLSSTAQRHINGVVLFGDPTYWPNERIDASGNGIEKGRLADFRRQNAMDAWTGVTVQPGSPNGGVIPLVRSFCFRQDLFCQVGGTSEAVHQSYNNATTVSQAATFLRGFVFSSQRGSGRETQ